MRELVCHRNQNNGELTVYLIRWSIVRFGRSYDGSIDIQECRIGFDESVRNNIGTMRTELVQASQMPCALRPIQVIRLKWYWPGYIADKRSDQHRKQIQFAQIKSNYDGHTASVRSGSCQEKIIQIGWKNICAIIKNIERSLWVK